MDEETTIQKMTMMTTIMMDDRSTQLMGVLNVYLAAAWHVEIDNESRQMMRYGPTI